MQGTWRVLTLRCLNRWRDLYKHKQSINQSLFIHFVYGSFAGNERASIDEKYETLRHQHNYISDIERQKIYAYMTAEERSKLYKMQYDLEA